VQEATGGREGREAVSHGEVTHVRATASVKTELAHPRSVTTNRAVALLCYDMQIIRSTTTLKRVVRLMSCAEGAVKPADTADQPLLQVHMRDCDEAAAAAAKWHCHTCCSMPVSCCQSVNCNVNEHVSNSISSIHPDKCCCCCSPACQRCAAALGPLHPGSLHLGL
jgi:hypothetical protein